MKYEDLPEESTFNDVYIIENAVYLDETEEFLQETLQYYKWKYGVYVSIDKYVIYFEPALGVFELV